ncbi:MAG: DUF4159 domain-containing protein [Verrucomicrobiae bacterium]|nr:DUF4159 domain-containing protein [Verrucomicrobiae bacterium]MCB1092032.1 DUF4159 domain-containing protein [Verrucomicrobiae bacterium]
MIALAGPMFLLAQDTVSDSQPTWFGITDGEVPRDPRDWGRGQHYDFPTWKVSPELPNDVFTFARLRYNSGTWMGRRSKWLIDYPDSDLNFAYRLQQLTSLEVNPVGVVVDIDPEQLRHYPFIYMIETGDIWLTDDEARILRDYLLNGGFIMVDDFWGIYEWNQFYRALKQIFPDREPVDLELDHPIFHAVFDLDLKPQIPAVGMAIMGKEQGITYEWNKPGAEEAHYRAVYDDKGRMCMMICWNTDLGDGWEEEGTDPWYFKEFSEKYAYPLGINIIFYAMTH